MAVNLKEKYSEIESRFSKRNKPSDSFIHITAPIQKVQLSCTP
jgi:hypothetical protein